MPTIFSLYFAFFCKFSDLFSGKKIYRSKGKPTVRNKNGKATTTTTAKRVNWFQSKINMQNHHIFRCIFSGCFVSTKKTTTTNMSTDNILAFLFTFDTRQRYVFCGFTQSAVLLLYSRLNNIVAATFFFYRIVQNNFIFCVFCAVLTSRIQFRCVVWVCALLVFLCMFHNLINFLFSTHKT